MMEYRNQLNDKRTKEASILSNSFWPNIYNNYDITQEEILPVLHENPTLNTYVQKTPEAWKYVWARMNFVSRHPSLLYWFVFWDDFWEENHEMTVLQDKIKFFGPNSPDSIMYRPMKRRELERFLEEHDLIDLSDPCCFCCGGRDLSLFFPKLLDKLYSNISSATWTLHPEDDDFMKGQAEIYQPRKLELLRTNSGNLAGYGLDTTGDGTVDAFDFGDGQIVSAPPPPAATQGEIDAYAAEQQKRQDELERTRNEIARVQAAKREQERQEQADREMAQRLREEEQRRAEAARPPPPPPPPGIHETAELSEAEQMRMQMEHVKRIQAQQKQAKLDAEMAARLGNEDAARRKQYEDDMALARELSTGFDNEGPA